MIRRYRLRAKTSSDVGRQTVSGLSEPGQAIQGTKGQVRTQHRQAGGVVRKDKKVSGRRQRKSPDDDSCARQGSDRVGDLKGNTFTARAFAHVAVSLDKLGEREDPSLEWQQHTVGGQLIDIAQCSLQGHLVLENAQFRLAGEIADAVHKELNVLLERRAG